MSRYINYYNEKLHATYIICLMISSNRKYYTYWMMRRTGTDIVFSNLLHFWSSSYFQGELIDWLHFWWIFAVCWKCFRCGWFTLMEVSFFFVWKNWIELKVYFIELSVRDGLRMKHSKEDFKHSKSIEIFFKKQKQLPKSTQQWFLWRLFPASAPSVVRPLHFMKDH